MEAAELVNMARRRAGLSQEELARRAGIAQPAISRIERGKVSPTFDTLARLLDVCGMRVVLEDRPHPDDVDRSLIEEWLRWTPRERIERAAEEWNKTAPFRRAG